MLQMADQRIALSRGCTQTARMLRLLCALLACLLLCAAPALAQDEAPVCSGSGDATADCTSGPAVGEPDVITDPSDEIEPPASSPEPDDPRAEQHVLGDSAQASSKDEKASQPVAAPASAPAPATADPVAASTPVAAPAAASSPRELPFTGVPAWLIALSGSLLLAAGLRLRAAA
jgi:hypothetical protein